jgi:hypothetical protein
VRTYLIIHVYAFLAFIVINIWLRALLGKTNPPYEDRTGGEGGNIVGLEVTKADSGIREV